MNRDIIQAVVNSRRGKICIIVNNYKYSKKNILRNKNVRFVCTNNVCSAAIFTDETYTRISNHFNDHYNHESYTDEEINIEILRNDVKTQSKLNTNVGPSKLIKTSV